MRVKGESLPEDSVVRNVITSIHNGIVGTAKSSLVGLYLCGSCVSGDFDSEASDIDLIAVLVNDPSDELGVALRAMHNALARRYPRWAGRIEVVYVAKERLANWNDGIPRMAVISPGEPFHIVEGGPDWVLTWFPAREEAVTLVGPPISTVIPEIVKATFLDAVREHMLTFRERVKVDDSRGAQAYAILTICRGLYTLLFEKRPSEIEAAAWSAQHSNNA